MFSYTEDSFLPFPPNQLLSPEQVFLFFSSFWNILNIFKYLCLNIWLMVGFHCSVRFFNHSTLYLIVHSVLVHTTFNSCVVFHNWLNESLVIDTWGCFLFYFFFAITSSTEMNIIVHTSLNTSTKWLLKV